MLLVRAGLLAATGVVAGIAGNLLRPDGIAFAMHEPAGTCSAPSVASSVERLTPAEVTEVCRGGGITVVDVRPEARFVGGHVAGAVHLPCSAGTGAADDLLRTLGGNSKVVLYGEGTDDALEVAESLARRASPKLDKVAVLAGGFRAWDQAGLACSSGPCEHCEVSKAP